MQTPARVAVAVGGGYLLGRTKKLKLAITLGSMVAGKKLSGGSGGLLGEAMELLRSSPEFDQLRRQIGGAGRRAAPTAATKPPGRVTSRIESRVSAQDENKGDEDFRDGVDEDEDTDDENEDDPA